MSAGSDQADATGFRRGATVLSAGIASSGVLTYAYFALSSHALPADDYGSLVVLWSVLFIAVVTLYRPVEQYVSRTISEQEVAGRSLARPLRHAAWIQLALALASTAVALLLRTPIEDDLLDGHESLYLIFLIAAPAYAVSFLARGYLAGRRRFGLYGGMLLLESTSRFAMAVVVVSGLAGGVDVAAIGIALAPLMSLTVVPLAFFLKGRGEVAAPAAEPDAAGLPDATDPGLAAGGRFVLSAFLIMLSEQALLNAGVLIAGVSAGSAAAGFLFNLLLIARAPQVLFMSVTTSLLPTLTRLRAGGGEEGERRFRREVGSTCLAVAGFVLAAGCVLAAIGPWLMRLVFGDEFAFERLDLLIVVAAMGFHLSALTLTQAALARDRAAAAAARWVGCGVGFVVLCLLPVLAEVRRVELAYLLAAAVLCSLLAQLELSGRREPSPAPLAAGPG